jgi:hypothetical protein
LKIPSLAQPLQESAVIDAGAFGKLRNVYSGSIGTINVSMSAPIVRLLNACRPSAIARLVVCIYINAINRVIFGWGAAHVSQKILIPIPARADLYTSAAITWIAWGFLVVAALAHTGPSSVFLGLCAAFSVRSLDLAVKAPQATTAFCVAVLECSAMHETALTTITQAVPSEKSAARAIRSLGNDGKHSEFLPNKVDAFHRLMITNLQEN